MAMKLDAGDVSRKDFFMIDPDHIIVSHDLNVRENQHTPEAIEALAGSIVEQGQIEPGLGRRVEGNKVHLVVGHCRWEAIKYINANKLTDEPLKLKVTLKDMNEEEAFSLAIDENLHRTNLTPLDVAFQQRILRERFNWTETAIAKKYSMTQAYVSTLRKTHQLDSTVQQEVREGNLPATVALEVADLPANEQKEVVEESKDPVTGKVDGAEVTKKTRNKKLEAGQKGKSRSMKEVRDFLESMTGPGETDKVRQLAQEMLKFIGGRMGDALMERRFRSVINGQEAA